MPDKTDAKPSGIQEQRPYTQEEIDRAIYSRLGDREADI